MGRGGGGMHGGRGGGGPGMWQSSGEYFFGAIAWRAFLLGGRAYHVRKE